MLDKSKLVQTRDGREVRIWCWDAYCASSHVATVKVEFEI